MSLSVYYIQQVLINSLVAGTFTAPTNDRRYPVVLLLHGFASNQNEIGNIYESLALKLAEKNIASLRIDFRCCGISIGDPDDFTLNSALEDAVMAVAYLQTHPLIICEKIGICGFSMGAGIAAMLTQAAPKIIQSLVMLSPTKNFLEDFREALGNQVLKKGLSLSKHDSVSFALPIHGKITTLRLRKPFFQSLEMLDINKALSRYFGDVLIIAGEKDFSHKNAVECINILPCKNKSFISLPNTDHVFNAFSDSNNQLQTIMNKVVNFFHTTLTSSVQEKIKET